MSLINPYINKGDQLWNNVTLSLSGQSFQDKSKNGGNRVATVVGGAALSAARTKWGSGNSIRLNASTDSIQFAHTANDWNLSQSDFCLEMWAYFDALVVGQQVINHGAFSSSPFHNWWISTGDPGPSPSGRRLAFAATNSAGFTFPNAREMLTSVDVLTAGQWQFIAFGRTGVLFYIWVDGVKYTYTDPANNGALNMDIDISNNSTPLTIGGFVGNVQDVRLTIGPGSNRYGSAASFSVPTAPFPQYGN